MRQFDTSMYSGLILYPSQMLEQITPLLLTYNEEPNIGRTLDALTWAGRIVVVDSGSTDGTLAILRSHPAVEVFNRPFDSHASQWNFALRSTGITTPWVLALDADYVLSGELVTELKGLCPNEGIAGYRADFIYCIAGKALRGSLYPPVVVLFRVDRGSYRQDGHTQRLELAGDVESLRGRIRHDDRKSLEQWFAAQSRYARLDADKLLSKSRTMLLWRDRARRGYLGPPLVLFYCLIVKGLIFDGRSGLYYSLQRVLAETMLALCLVDSRLRRARLR